MRVRASKEYSFFSWLDRITESSPNEESAAPWSSSQQTTGHLTILNGEEDVEFVPDISDDESDEDYRHIPRIKAKTVKWTEEDRLG